MDGRSPIFLLSSWFILLFWSFCDALPNAERDALIAFKAAIHDPTNALDSWDPNSVNPCTWFHITCDENQHVTRIDLALYQLSGSLVPDLGNLHILNALILFGNDLTGSLPKELGNLQSLMFLDMSRNQFTGSLPEELGQLRNLEVLRLNSNMLSGSIPQSLAGISTLNTLDLSNNDLTGPIPTGGSFTNFGPSSFQGNPGLCGQVIMKNC